MTADHREGAEARLDALLRAARDNSPPSDDLVARVLADAVAVQVSASAPDSARAPAPIRRPRPLAVPRARSGLAWAAGIVANLGGWASVSGVTAAGVIGLAVGYAVPDAITTLPGGGDWLAPGDTAADIMPDIGGLWLDPLSTGSRGEGDGDV